MPRGLPNSMVCSFVAYCDIGFNFSDPLVIHRRHSSTWSFIDTYGTTPSRCPRPTRVERSSACEVVNASVGPFGTKIQSKCDKPSTTGGFNDWRVQRSEGSTTGVLALSLPPEGCPTSSLAWWVGCPSRRCQRCWGRNSSRQIL